MNTTKLYWLPSMPCKTTQESITLLKYTDSHTRSYYPKEVQCPWPSAFTIPGFKFGLFKLLLKRRTVYYNIHLHIIHYISNYLLSWLSIITDVKMSRIKSVCFKKLYN